MFENKNPVVEYSDFNEDGSYSKFVVEPLVRGYGITLGNALRRFCCPHCQAQLSAAIQD